MPDSGEPAAKVEERPWNRAARVRGNTWKTGAQEMHRKRCSVGGVHKLINEHVKNEAKQTIPVFGRLYLKMGLPVFKGGCGRGRF